MRLSHVVERDTTCSQSVVLTHNVVLRDVELRCLIYWDLLCQ